MLKTYEKDTVIIKLIYYCCSKREVYFKRSDVTEYIVSESPFDIPNKQGFDGNLSYFGYDIQNDSDKNRILLLRGKELNNECLSGNISFSLDGGNVSVECANENIFNEIDMLIKNKTAEASAFRVFKNISTKRHLQESTHRLFGNKKLFISNSDQYYTYPRILIDNINNRVIYELVNTPNFIEYVPNIIFPIYNEHLNHVNEVILEYEYFFDRNILGDNDSDFIYLVIENDIFRQIDIQAQSLTEIISQINIEQYNLEGRDTTIKVITNSRLNTSSLRNLALERDSSRCLLCEVDETNLLICSHIKPWRTGEGRLDLDNVLTLCSAHDALFDKGYIAINDNGNILLSSDPVLSKSIIKDIITNSNSRIGLVVNDRMRSYLKHHRDNIFKG
ncbi:hypothetical protein B4O97_14365 [Marispirochaeta aestuarii]|uniref:HNH nuclease domain-containing protein n=1 Tax=Marispirochaeta aestuarii TaxID=1963862 RepID=A0A1Y1RV62_9SPIO|nr:HNH endonuclease [Marispirochaeta aestuarii]ORC33844.1 hypothetical protein B4O97_14365 [Marispirochaeta aestuarii]